MIQQNQILSFLQKNKNRFQKDYHLTKLGVFGSVARDEQTNISDIDIIVEFEENTENLYNIKQSLKSEIENRFKTSVDICREKYIKSIFREAILNDAKFV